MSYGHEMRTARAAAHPNEVTHANRGLTVRPLFLFGGLVRRPNAGRKSRRAWAHAWTPEVAPRYAEAEVDGTDLAVFGEV